MFYLTYVFLQHVLLTRFWTISVVIVWIKLIVMSHVELVSILMVPKMEAIFFKAFNYFLGGVFPVVAKLCFNFHLHGKYFVVQRVH